MILGKADELQRVEHLDRMTADAVVIAHVGVDDRIAEGRRGFGLQTLLSEQTADLAGVVGAQVFAADFRPGVADPAVDADGPVEQPMDATEELHFVVPDEISSRHHHRTEAALEEFLERQAVSEDALPPMKSRSIWVTPNIV